MTSLASYSTPDPGDREALESDFALLAQVTRRLGEDTGARLEQADDDLAALELLYDLREARKLLQELEASVEAEAARRMSAPVVEWPGFRAERKGGAVRKNWQHDQLAWVVMRAALSKENDGQVPSEQEMATAAIVRDALLNAAAVSYWRTTQLRNLGITPDNYCTSERGRRTVIVTPITPEASEDAA